MLGNGTAVRFYLPFSCVFVVYNVRRVCVYNSTHAWSVWAAGITRLRYPSRYHHQTPTLIHTFYPLIVYKGSDMINLLVEHTVCFDFIFDLLTRVNDRCVITTAQLLTNGRVRDTKIFS